MRPIEITKRYALVTVGLFFSALGVAFARHGALGVSPISSVANVLSLRFPAVSMGNWLILWNFLLILGQVVILRRKFRPIQLLQIPVSFLFGWFTDLGLAIVAPIPADRYLLQLLMVALGVLILGFGIALAVIADAVMNAGEAFVKTVADALHKNFGNVKIVFDVSCVTLSVLLSLLLFGGKLMGTREGTVIAALCTGLSVKLWSRLLRTPLTQFLTAAKKNQEKS